LLSVQPLVENAVKHGIAPKMGTGFVRLDITARQDVLSVLVSNSGECDASVLRNTRKTERGAKLFLTSLEVRAAPFALRTDAPAGGGIGLANVRRRLELCYGQESSFVAEVEDGVTSVGFLLPLRVGAMV
jgi:sensor histidine kinase YesM